MSSSSKHPDYLDALRQCPRPMKMSAEHRKRVRNGGKRALLFDLTEGFYGGNWKGDEIEPEEGGIASWDPNDPVSIKAAEFAISKLNDEEQKNLTLKEIVRVNWRLVFGVFYFLTIRASDDKFYEAKVLFGLNDTKELDFIRPARHYPKVNPEFLKYDAPHAARND